MLANTLFPVIMLLKIHICGGRRTLKVAVRRKASFMVGFLLTGPSALPGRILYPKVMHKILFYLFWKRTSVEDSPCQILFCLPWEPKSWWIFFSHQRMQQALSALSTRSISMTVASTDGGHWGVSWSAFWEAEHASLGNPDSGVPDGSVNWK